jgi:hypothetical protein
MATATAKAPITAKATATAEADLTEIFERVKEDPSLFSTLDVNRLLEKIENEHYLENKSTNDISKDIFDAMEELNLPADTAMDYCMRLSGYRLVDKICDLRYGRWMRWIKTTDKKLTNGGLLMNVKIDARGSVLLCKNNANRFFNVRYDDCIIFQKLTMEEQFVLLANEPR